MIGHVEARRIYERLGKKSDRKKRRNGLRYGHCERSEAILRGFEIHRLHNKSRYGIWNVIRRDSARASVACANEK